jgi:TetR/AcrR family transcriptional regulator
MFEQDRLQGRINQLFERIEAQLRQVLREKKMREGEGYTLDETLLASQMLAFCEGCCRALCAASSNTVRRTILTPAGR